MRAHLYMLSLVMMSTGLACDAAPDAADPRKASPAPQGDEVCGYRTETQTSWGAACKGNKPGCFRDEHFSAAFPEGLYAGCGEYTANLLTSDAVAAALPSDGTPRALLASEAVAYDGVDDPEVTTSLFGEVVALSLNLEFAALPAFHTTSHEVPLADLVLAEGACAGLSVAQILDEANLALAGCPAAFTPAQIDGCVAAINASFTGTKGKKTVCSELYEAPE